MKASSLPVSAKPPLPPVEISGAVLKIVSGPHKGRQFRLLSLKITIGRHNDCDIIFKDNPHCSRHHAEIKRENGVFSVKSLNPDNPVLINKKPITVHRLSAKDRFSIGNTDMVFETQAPFAVPKIGPQNNNIKAGAGQKKKALNPARLILICLALGAGALFLSEDKKPQDTQSLEIKTEADIIEGIEEIEKNIKKTDKEKSLSPQQQAARTAFIKGYRDYRKGYFQRALKTFQHCLTLNKNHPLCNSYSQKSITHIERLIQKKILLGRAYKKKKQYSACQMIFKSVETMIRDPESPIYKEAQAHRKSCEVHLKNPI